MLAPQAIVLLLASGIVLAALVTWMVTRLVLLSRTAALKAQLGQMEETRQALAAAQAENQKLREQLVQARTERQAQEEKLQWLVSAEEKLREAFESLASRALNTNSQQLLNQSKRQLETLVKPINDELGKLDRNVRTLEEKREGAYNSIDTAIRQISQQYTNLQETTTTLSQALRSTAVRGRWGEVQLHRIAEMAGLTEHVDFDEQKGTGEGGRPDMVVHLPNSAILPVDAKAPMNAYLEAQEAEDTTVRAAKLKQHAAALRKHVQQLSQKAYWGQFDVAPEFVVLMVPYESGLAAAFSADADLLEYALANKVVVAGPATLLALLKVVAYGWMQLELSRNAQEIAAQGQQLLERLGPFFDHFNKLGASLGGAVDKFNDAAGSLERRVLPTARRLKELGAGTLEAPDATYLDSRPRSVDS